MEVFRFNIISTKPKLQESQNIVDFFFKNLCQLTLVAERNWLNNSSNFSHLTLVFQHKA